MDGEEKPKKEKTQSQNGKRFREGNNREKKSITGAEWNKVGRDSYIRRGRENPAGEAKGRREKF